MKYAIRIGDHCILVGDVIETAGFKFEIKSINPDKDLVAVKIYNEISFENAIIPINLLSSTAKIIELSENTNDPNFAFMAKKSS